MRVLIATVALFAYAAAAPSGALLAAPYAAHGLVAPYAAHGVALAHGAPLAVAHAAPVAVAHAAHLAPALPTISPGDIQGAAIEAHVDASDHARAAVDQAREFHDQAKEINGQAINAAEDHSWQAVDAVKTAEAQLDGAAAGAAPVLAKSLVGHVAPAVVAAPAVHAYAAPAVHAYGAPAVHAYGAPAVHGYAAPAVAAYAAPAVHAYAAPAVAHSKSVVTQSLSQTHPAPAVHAPLVYSAPIYKAHHGAIAHGW